MCFTINIAVRYIFLQDSRFNQEIDKKTGYRTRSILCMPVLDHEGEVELFLYISILNYEGEVELFLCMSILNYEGDV